MDGINVLIHECAIFQRELDEAQLARQGLLDDIEAFHVELFSFESVREELKALSSELKWLSSTSRDELAKTRSSMYKNSLV